MSHAPDHWRPPSSICSQMPSLYSWPALSVECLPSMQESLGSVSNNCLSVILLTPNPGCLGNDYRRTRSSLWLHSESEASLGFTVRAPVPRGSIKGKNLSVLSLFAILCFVLVFCLNLQSLWGLERLVGRVHLLTSALMKVLLPCLQEGAALSDTSFHRVWCTGVEPLPGSASTQCLKRYFYCQDLTKGWFCGVLLLYSKQAGPPLFPAVNLLK